MAASTTVMLAVPVSELAHVVRAVLPHLPDECLVLHASSLQRREALGLTEMEFRRVLGTHPIAGAERSGFAAADPAMFRGATVRAEARATGADRAGIETLWRGAGVARIIWDESAAHDALMSWISHLSQITATALAAVLAEEGISPRDLGPGARDATRLAASDLVMWAPILERAPPETVVAVRRLTSALRGLGDALEAHDAPTVAQTWQDARSWRMRAEDPG
jgi:prephenate dehydrogenase